MARINQNFSKLPDSYLFTRTAVREAKWILEHSGRDLVRLGVGDVSLPIPQAAADAMAKAAQEMGTRRGFHGYGPEQGYQCLRAIIAEHDFQNRHADISPDEIFLNDGAKSDCGGILDLFSKDCVIALCDPCYPAYVDSAVLFGMAGEYDPGTGHWSRFQYLTCDAQNCFVPSPDTVTADLVWLCFPNNPTGAVASREQLRKWVDWANDRGAVLLFDAAYEAYITDPAIPHSIFEIPGSKSCAIELRSYSKTAGFTGVRCGYTVIPRELRREGANLMELWKRRQAARFNGVSYINHCGVKALYTYEGEKQVAECIEYYHENAEILRSCFEKNGLPVYGGIHSPYLWVRAPHGLDSSGFYDLLLEYGVAATPGNGFGPAGEGYLRFTSFSDREKTLEAVRRIDDAVSSLK